jgi:NAD(P)-dependent dehydrogenase (short-subunit alcohol dehydrogenase family)
VDRPDPTTVPMIGRLAGKTAIVVGAEQREGDTIGNGRAIAELLGRAGASVLCVDRHGDRAEATVAAIAADGGTAEAFDADITHADHCDAIVARALRARHDHWRNVSVRGLPAGHRWRRSAPSGGGRPMSPQGPSTGW